MMNCTENNFRYLLYFDPRPGPKILFQGNTPEGSDTFKRPDCDTFGCIVILVLGHDFCGFLWNALSLEDIVF